MARNITVIPANENNINNEDFFNTPKKRMCAYCRVSTDYEEQLSSYEAQVNYYKTYITNHPDYEFSGVYADEGISGTSTKKREQFNKMIDDCKDGKIDMIITKSISRFTRNTLDCLNFVRALKEVGVGVIFEKENINTLDSKGEVLLSILSSLAQDESRSISENCTWGLRRRFEQGKVIINHTKFIGYDKDRDGNLIINEKQEEIVKRIYNEFLNGKGSVRIARELEFDGVPNWHGRSRWYEGNIRNMLSNEKYKGEALLQKTYTVDFLTKKRAENNGVVPKYYIENSHPAIIDKETWEAVQLEFERRKKYMEKHKIKQLDVKPFTGRVICGECGYTYSKVIWNSKDEKLRRYIWRCNKKYIVKGEINCTNKHIDDYILYDAFVEAFNRMVDNIDCYMDRWNGLLDGDDVWLKVTARRFIEIFSEEERIDKFEEELFLKLVEKIVVLDGNVKVCFLDGSEI